MPDAVMHTPAAAGKRSILLPLLKNRKKICFVFYFFFLMNVLMAQRLPCNEITADMGFTVKSVVIKARWLPETLQAKAEQMIGIGQPFNPAAVSPVLNLVRDELIQGETSFAFQIIRGSTSVLYVTSDVCDVSNDGGPKAVEITIRAWYLRVDLFNIGNNLLPLPRSARPVFYSNVPKPLLATAPLPTFTNDRSYGPAIGLQTFTDLLHMPGIVKPGEGSKKLRLELALNARKSFSHPFYNIGAGLNLVHPAYSDSAVGWNIGFLFGQNDQPLADAYLKNKLARIYGALQGNLKSKWLSKYIAGAGARFLQNQYSINHTTAVETPENGYEFFAVSDGSPGKGFSRFGVWFDAADPRNNPSLKSYQRLASRFGYAVSLGKGHRQFDMEAAVGAGHAWGNAPVYNQYFAGNSSWNFLYDPIASARNQFMPAGPVIRSLGEREGALSSQGNIAGGSSFWHLNINFSIPVVGLSRPLIPEVVISEEPRVITLRSALKSQASTAENFIIDDLIENHGYPDDETTEQKGAEIVDRDVRPTLNYLADKANVYSFKPVLLFDIAGMRNRIDKSQTFVAAGLGVQLNIVVARFEAGYMYTLAPSSYTSKGNLFVRLTLQNFY